jgi:hypothetical protein
VLDVACIRDLRKLAVGNDVDADPLLALDLNVDSLADDCIEQLV